jgi:hypothetical protein
MRLYKSTAKTVYASVKCNRDWLAVATARPWGRDISFGMLLGAWQDDWIEF